MDQLYIPMECGPTLSLTAAFQSAKQVGLLQGLAEGRQIRKSLDDILSQPSNVMSIPCMHTCNKYNTSTYMWKTHDVYIECVFFGGKCVRIWHVRDMCTWKIMPHSKINHPYMRVDHKHSQTIYVYGESGLAHECKSAASGRSTAINHPPA